MPNSKNYAESHADKLDYIYISPILFVLAVSSVCLHITFDTGRTSIQYEYHQTMKTNG